MPNVILPNLGIELPDVGSDQDTWGDILNSDLGILDLAVQYDAIAKTLGAADVTLTDAEAASAVINLTGTLTANVNLIVPVSPVRLYLVNNGTTGAFTVTVKTPLGTGVTVLQGANSLVYSDGTNIIQGATSVNGSFAVSGALTAGSLNNTPVGNTTPSSGAFTTLSASGATTLNGAVTLGDAEADAITVTGTPTFATAASFAAGTAALPSITTTGDLNTGRYFPAADTIADVTAGVERWRIDPAGNGGLGVTPSALWSASADALQIGPSTSLFNPGSNSGSIFATNSIFTSGVSTAVYQTTNAATHYYQDNGTHKFFTAPSGTAGNPITFTQALTLTQAQNLLLGGTADPGGNRALYIANTTLVPGTPSGGGVLYVEAGALKYKGSAGTVTTLAPA